MLRKKVKKILGWGLGLLGAASLLGWAISIPEKYPKGLPKEEQKWCPSADPYGAYGDIECRRREE